jgi:hypothetical protein
MTRVALIDGALAPGAPGLVAVTRFDRGESGEAGPRHAAAMAAAILAAAPEARLVNLVVFGGGLSKTAAIAAQALAAAGDASVALCAFGLARDDAAVRAAVATLTARGVAVVAAAPARGGPVWPAALPDVVSVQGDARCGPGDWSVLDLPSAGWGACPAGPDPGVAGASVAAARFAGLLAAGLARAGTEPPADPGFPSAALRSRVLDELRATARFRGRERRGGAEAGG